MLLLQALTDSLDLRAHFQGNRDTWVGYVRKIDVPNSGIS
jgi:hypothetical protein